MTDYDENNPWHRRELEGPRVNRRISDRRMRKSQRKAAKIDEKFRQKHKQMFGHRPRSW